MMLAAPADFVNHNKTMFERQCSNGQPRQSHIALWELIPDCFKAFPPEHTPKIVQSEINYPAMLSKTSKRAPHNLVYEGSDLAASDPLHKILHLY